MDSEALALSFSYSSPIPCAKSNLNFMQPGHINNLPAPIPAPFGVDRSVICCGRRIEHLNHYSNLKKYLALNFGLLLTGLLTAISPLFALPDISQESILILTASGGGLFSLSIVGISLAAKRILQLSQYHGEDENPEPTLGAI